MVAANHLRMKVVPEYCLAKLLPVTSGFEVLPLLAYRFEPGN